MNFPTLACKPCATPLGLTTHHAAELTTKIKTSPPKEADLSAPLKLRQGEGVKVYGDFQVWRLMCRGRFTQQRLHRTLGEADVGSFRSLIVFVIGVAKRFLTRKLVGCFLRVGKSHLRSQDRDSISLEKQQLHGFMVSLAPLL